MELNHHILAKRTTDAVLFKFKSEKWTCVNGIGKDFLRIGTDANFPSPDAEFYDEDNHFLLSFEFKPPTETKRGILTGVGQSIAYLQESNASYLIAPMKLEGFEMGRYLTDLYKYQIFGKIPSGLILYQNDDPDKVELASSIPSSAYNGKNTDLEHKRITPTRYWAKHLDLPIPLFHLLLHCYYLKKSHTIEGDAFEYCWFHYMVSPTVVEDFQPKRILDCNGKVIYTVAGSKLLILLEKRLADNTVSVEKKKELIAKEIDTHFTGDNLYNSYKKNFTTFMKHIRVIDSSGEITDSGFKLYHLGLLNGPRSKMFREYFAKEVLTTGHHLELLIDLDKISRDNTNKTFKECLSIMERQYEERGFIKRNPMRKAKAKSNVGFLKYECILWRSLNLLTKTGRYKYEVNWKLLIEICSLPDL